MQIQLNIPFDQLIEIVKALPARQLKRLKNIIDKEEKAEKAEIDLENLLLKGPTATKKQLETIFNNRKEIDKWQTN